MTGDSSRREKVQAVLFSLIMVVSMVGIGAAGFAGSAAAAAPDSPTDDPGELQVSVLNSSTGTVNATYAVNTTSDTINVTNGSVTDQQVASVDSESAKAIQLAIDNSTDENSTVRVGPGTYNGSVVINDEGLTLEAAEGAEPVINGSGAGNAVEAGADDVTVRGFQVEGFAERGIYDGEGENDGMLIEDNVVTDPDPGAATVQAIQIEGDNAQVIDNTVAGVPEFEGDDFDSTGILAESTDNAEIRNNTVEVNDLGIAISTFFGNATGNTIEGNEVSSTNSDAIQAGTNVLADEPAQNSASDTEIIDNTVEDSPTGLGIRDFGGAGISGTNVSDNDFVDNGVHVNVNAPGGKVNFVENQIKQGETGIAVDATNSADRINIDSVTINGTNTAGIDVDGVNANAAVNVTNSALTENEEAVRLSNSAGDAQLNVHFNTFEENVVGVADDPGTVAATHNLTFNDFINNDDAVVLDDGIGGTVNANYNWWGATNGPSGDFNGNGSSVSYNDASDISINPATVKKDDGNVALEQDFLGVVKDSQNVTLNGSSSDATYSFSTNDSDTVPGANNSAEVDGTLVLGLNGTDYVFKDALNEGEVDTSVSGAEADSGKNGTSIANTTPTGDTAITVVGNNSTTAVDDTGTIRLVHEAVGLSEGFNLKSVPQPAKLYTQDVDATNQWDSDDDTYESPDISQGEDVDSGTNLHRGLYVDAASSDARLGYSFATSEVPRPADVVMGNGWHLVGSNFDINSESGTRELDVDLRNVENVTTDGSPGVTAYDSGLSGDIAGSSDINEYDTYWVYVDGEQTRVIVAPNYDPNGR